MGATHVTVTVRNIAEINRSWDGLFLVDTGAIDCVVPRKYLDEVGIVPVGKRSYGLADGSDVSFEYAWAEIEFMGDTIYSRILFGGENSEPLLGFLALETVGIEVDPLNQRLKRSSTLRLR